MPDRLDELLELAKAARERMAREAPVWETEFDGGLLGDSIGLPDAALVAAHMQFELVGEVRRLREAPDSLERWVQTARDRRFSEPAQSEDWNAGYAAALQAVTEASHFKYPKTCDLALAGIPHRAHGACPGSGQNV